MREYLSSELDDEYKYVNFNDYDIEETFNYELGDEYKYVNFNDYDIEETFNYDEFFNNLVDIYEKVVGRREIVVHNNPGFIPSSIRYKVKEYNNLKKSAGFRGKTVQNKKLLRDMDIDIKTSLSEYKKDTGEFCSSISDITDAKEFWSLIKKVQ
eukprot:Awhi_evm1s5017